MTKSINCNRSELNHIVFYTSKLSETIYFWDSILGLKNKGSKDCPNYKVGKFTVMFLYSEKASKDYSHTIGHLGFELPSQKEINSLYESMQKKSDRDIKKPIGGGSDGPYRFYIKDPNQILLEFETWEGCDNPWKDRSFD